MTSADAAREVLTRRGFPSSEHEAAVEHAPALARFRLALDSEQAVEDAARALAAEDVDGCFGRVQADGDDPSESDVEDCDYYRQRARALLGRVLAHAEREAQP